MEDGYKHFSHMHNLMMHEMPEGGEISCSGCNSSGRGTVYVCWQCNFFLHEQCFGATRSRKHPSHPNHPLTLVPYPTYPSNSFYCNSCKFTGTGFAYSCSDCDFDLHVHCAYSISSISTNYHQPPLNTHYHATHANQSFSNLNGQISSMAPNLASVSDPTDNQNTNTGAQYSSGSPTVTFVYASTSNQNPIFSTPNSFITQNIQSFSVPTSDKITSTPPDVTVSFATNTQASQYQESGQNRAKDQEIMHFSHPHGLYLFNSETKTSSITCMVCQKSISGKHYFCDEPNCDEFHLHESCFHLKKEILHKSHPNHLLILLSSTPYGNVNRGYTCDACFSDGTGFTYHCSICKFDLHTRCATMAETVRWGDHEHPLKLYYECPLKNKEYVFYCDVCHGVVEKDNWTYYCEGCDYGTHVGCVDREECYDPNGVTVFDAQTSMQQLHMVMELARLNPLLSHTQLRY